MKINHDHPWNITFTEAVEIQRRLQTLVNTGVDCSLKSIETIAAADVSYSRHGKQLFAAVVLVCFPEMKIISSHFANSPVGFPYIPGLLSFREIPPLLTIFKEIEENVDVIFCDGQGIAHPRQFGLAAHLGVLLDKPTLGCAKSYLYGEYVEPALEKGSFSALTSSGKTVGVVLRTRRNVKPVFVSPGHKMTVDNARELVMACVNRFRLPEPLRMAHREANRFREQSEGGAFRKAKGLQTSPPLP